MVELAANAPEWKRTNPDGVLAAEKLEEALLHLDMSKARTVINQGKCKAKPEVD